MPESEQTPLPNSFGYRLQQRFAAEGQLCVGIDPHSSLLAEWGLPDSATGALEFGRAVIEAAKGRVGILKPQVSFFERFGAEGYAALEFLLQEAQESGFLVIADAKRGDIGTTMQAYLEAWLGRGAKLPSDALTVSPYLGASVYIDQFAEYHERGRGLFSLVATSNPEGIEVQREVANVQWSNLAKVNAITSSAGESLGSFGAVMGATLNFATFGITLDASADVLTPILAPGFGAQGALLRDFKSLFGGYSRAVIASVSRSVLQAGPNGLAAAIDEHNRELARALP